MVSRSTECPLCLELSRLVRDIMRDPETAVVQDEFDIDMNDLCPAHERWMEEYERKNQGRRP